MRNRHSITIIAAGRFYAVTDNVRPYVDHDFPFGGMDIVQERVENLLELHVHGQR